MRIIRLAINEHYLQVLQVPPQNWGALIQLINPLPKDQQKRILPVLKNNPAIDPSQLLEIFETRYHRSPADIQWANSIHPQFTDWLLKNRKSIADEDIPKIHSLLDQWQEIAQSLPPEQQNIMNFPTIESLVQFLDRQRSPGKEVEFSLEGLSKTTRIYNQDNVAIYKVLSGHDAAKIPAMFGISGWCTGDAGVAERSYLCDGPLYIVFLNDFPVAQIHMESNQFKNVADRPRFSYGILRQIIPAIISKKLLGHGGDFEVIKKQIKQGEELQASVNNVMEEIRQGTPVDEALAHNKMSHCDSIKSIPDQVAYSPEAIKLVENAIAKANPDLLAMTYQALPPKLQQIRPLKNLAINEYKQWLLQYPIEYGLLTKDLKKNLELREATLQGWKRVLSINPNLKNKVPDSFRKALGIPIDTHE
jgi:hypothetical protein